MSKQPTPAELIGSSVLTGVFCLSTYAAWRAGSYWALVVMMPLALLFLWGVVDMLRQGTRQTTAFERFEARHFMRFLVLMGGGGAVVLLLVWAGYGVAATLLLLVVVVSALWAARKLRGRNETGAGYKHRVGYPAPNSPQNKERR